MEKNDQEDIITSENNDDVELESEAEPEAEAVTDWEAEAKRQKGLASRYRTKYMKATEKKIAPKTGELDESQLDFLDVKGITDERKIEVIQKVVAKTGQTVRQALKDDYVLAKFAAIDAEDSVKNATPSGTKRSGNQSNDLATALAKFDQTGEFPADYALKTQVVNAIVDRDNTNRPAWHK